MLYTFKPSTDYKFILIGGLNIDLIAGNLSIVSYLLAATALIAIGICITVSFIVSRHINLPLQKSSTPCSLWNPVISTSGRKL